MLEPSTSDAARAALRRLRVLLVEDDPADALVVRELLGEGGHFDVTWVTTRHEAVGRGRDEAADCALVDLGLPDGDGLEVVTSVLAAGSEVAVVVLTGRADRQLARQAVAAGAQDYLIKDELNADLLDRTLHLAVERRRTGRAAVALAQARVRQEHNRQIAQGLLPRLRVRDPRLRMVTRYEPGNAGEVLGGDFLDAVELEDGTVRAIVGDVSGHGPGEAAIGVNLRIAWRALTLAENPPALTFRLLNDQLIHDTPSDEVFATAVGVTVSPDRTRLMLQIAGHPHPILLTGTDAAELDVRQTTVIGFAVDDVPPEPTVALPDRWRLLLYTDGLVEGRDGDRAERWGVDGLLASLRDHASLGPEAQVDAVLGEATRRNGGPLPDDVAMLLIVREG